MSQYVEANYSDGYVEDDSVIDDGNVEDGSVIDDGDLETPLLCDLDAVLSKLTLLESQNQALNTKLDTLLSGISSNKALSLSINDKLVSLINNLDLSNLVTKDYIDSSVPFVDDKSILIYPKGSEVLTAFSGGIFIVESSCLLPINEYDFTVVYTLSKEIDGVKQYSNFNSKYVVLYSEENYMLVSDCASVNGG